MSSKAEKTSHHSHQQPRLSIFFRNPLLLKVVAWLGSLSFLGSTGGVWADLKPISTTSTEVPEIIQSSASASVGINTVVKTEEREIYGPYQQRSSANNCQIEKYQLLLPLHQLQFYPQAQLSVRNTPMC
jgi:hypothetical protein